ncbi:hypothetical protein [Carnobacterium maltaromaticum]|uniref:hypothetical protein n=1 Tax=Carnobacterium maltaromaticum TaxID=2751 RepID=UPI00295F2198|nr:hypothetical protein [Carnobacterium maltaromaticum]
MSSDKFYQVNLTAAELRELTVTLNLIRVRIKNSMKCHEKEINNLNQVNLFGNFPNSVSYFTTKHTNLVTSYNKMKQDYKIITSLFEEFSDAYRNLEEKDLDKKFERSLKEMVLIYQ